MQFGKLKYQGGILLNTLLAGIGKVPNPEAAFVLLATYWLFPPRKEIQNFFRC